MHVIQILPHATSRLYIKITIFIILNAPFPTLRAVLYFQFSKLDNVQS